MEAELHETKLAPEKYGNLGCMKMELRRVALHGILSHFHTFCRNLVVSWPARFIEAQNTIQQQQEPKKFSFQLFFFFLFLVHWDVLEFLRCSILYPT